VAKPVLWHIPISHYSEKARWALAWKRIEHERRAPLPGVHIACALWLTRGAQKTFPVLQLDGETIGDSTAILEALERSHPEQPLYPADAAERRRALELEEFFDERLGPAIRLAVWHDARADRESMEDLSRKLLPGPLREFGPALKAGAAFGSAYVQLRFRVASEEAAAAARTDVVAALDRLESELARAGGEHLAGDGFSVADLTAASLFYPLALPAEGPQTFTDVPPGFEEFRGPLADRPGLEWVRRTFAAYR
jgi:glutathione S-transferase